MSKNYKNYLPLKQSYKMSCWAACLEWWTKYMSPKKTLQSETGLIYDARALGYSPNVQAEDQDNYAALQIENVKSFLERPDIGMAAQRISAYDMTPRYVRKKLKNAPMLIYYYDSEVGGAHANVIVKCVIYNSGRSSLVVMEPDTGTFQERDITYYYNEGDTLIGWLP